MSIEVRRALDRFETRSDGIVTRHSFSFGPFYDPGNLGFSAMSAFNDENLQAGSGYPDHQHRDTEIVTWVLEGSLVHTDGDGRSVHLGAGDVQRISAGDGIVHAEIAEPGASTRFLQTWLRPDEPGGAPAYGVEGELGTGPGLTEVIGPHGLRVRTAGARLLLGHCEPGQIALPEAARMHVFVVDGRVVVGDRVLDADDAARLSDQGGRDLVIEEPAVLAVWAFSV
ncbi:MAG TPA: pirin family protein [Marmoricola sp.]|jgi:hypothetical protein|nr:pirin family protein [Marmoricola sp.]